MSLDLKPLHLHSVIMECLNIESFEHCYFIPVLAQTAEYWGDAQVASTCNLMSRQVKQYFNHAAHLSFYISKKNKDLNHDVCLHNTYHNFSNNMQLETKPEDYYDYQSQGQSLNISNDINNTLQFTNASSFLLNTYEKEKKSLLKSLHEIDKNLLQVLGARGDKLDTDRSAKTFPPTLLPTNIRSVQHDDCFLLLKILRNRKMWKATRWYPLVSKLTSNERMFHVSRSFMRISKSENDVSALLTQLMHRESAWL